MPLPRRAMRFAPFSTLVAALLLLSFVVTTGQQPAARATATNPSLRLRGSRSTGTP